MGNLRLGVPHLVPVQAGAGQHLSSVLIMPVLRRERGQRVFDQDALRSCFAAAAAAATAEGHACSFHFPQARGYLKGDTDRGRAGYVVERMQRRYLAGCGHNAYVYYWPTRSQQSQSSRRSGGGRGGRDAPPSLPSRHGSVLAGLTLCVYKAEPSTAAAHCRDYFLAGADSRRVGDDEFAQLVKREVERQGGKLVSSPTFHTDVVVTTVPNVDRQLRMWKGWVPNVEVVSLDWVVRSVEAACVQPPSAYSLPDPLSASSSPSPSPLD
uniref:BRCT domain-containing protein n=1 Tax=Palpitomonas bilix TaxID=652834 RepID=A0A7S3CY21_9EUKA